MNNINDNSNNNFNMEARTAYSSALMNVFDRIMSNENAYINSNSIFSNETSFNSHPSSIQSPLSPLFFPPRNSNIRNLLRETLNQKNCYKKVLSEKGSLQIKKLKFTEDMTNNKCPILLEKFKKDEEVSVLPCEHVFNTEAITEWLTTTQANCPVCRFELDSKEIKISQLASITEENDSDADSDDSIMSELEYEDEIIDEQDISNNLYTSDRYMMELFETLMNMRRPRSSQLIENNNISSSFNNIINNMENSREVQLAILASINENNGNNNNDD